MPAEESTAFHQAEDGAPSYIVGDSPDDDVMAASCTSSPDQSETSEIRKLSNRQKNVDEEGGDSAYSSTAASEGFSAADSQSDSKERQNSVDDKKDVYIDNNDVCGGGDEALRRARGKQSPAKISRINFQEDVQVAVTSADLPGFDADANEEDDDEEDPGDEVEEAVGGVQRPNGGFGWVVMMASFFSHAFGGGILYRWFLSRLNGVSGQISTVAYQNTMNC